MADKTMPGFYFNKYTFVNSDKNGRWKNGDTYYGRVNNRVSPMVPTGYGKMTYNDGSYYMGNWIDGDYVEGVKFYTDGSFYLGTWVNNKLDKGIMINADGSIQDGTWVNNNLVKGIIKRDGIIIEQKGENFYINTSNDKLAKESDNKLANESVVNPPPVESKAINSIKSDNSEDIATFNIPEGDLKKVIDIDSTLDVSKTITFENVSRFINYNTILFIFSDNGNIKSKLFSIYTLHIAIYTASLIINNSFVSIYKDDNKDIVIPIDLLVKIFNGAKDDNIRIIKVDIDNTEVSPVNLSLPDGTKITSKITGGTRKNNNNKRKEYSKKNKKHRKLTKCKK
jgi:hypothetical protein